MDDANKSETRDIFEYFNGQEVTQDALTVYCTKKGYEVMFLDDYKDLLRDQKQDERLKHIIPRVFTALSEYEVMSVLLSESGERDVSLENDSLSKVVADIFEEEGVMYDEVRYIIKGLKRIADETLSQAESRLLNMCALAMKDKAKDAFGEKLVVKDMANYSRDKLGYGNRRIHYR